MDCDVVVIGAGLAGLECARTLHGAGRTVQVLEAADEVGGRVRSERIDGFTVDRGFQLLNPAYPAVRHRVDVAALDLRSFDAGVAVRRDDGLAVLGDPRRAPHLVGRTVASGYLRPRELASLARWAVPALGPVPRLLSRPDVTLSESLHRAGVRGPLRREVLEPFLTGVLADDPGPSSAAFVRLLVRSFLLGTPAVPAEGMAALPRLLGADLVDRLTLGARVDGVEAVESRTWRTTTAAGSWTSRAVVVATDPPTAERLLGVRAPRMNGLVTHWYATDEPPQPARLLVVDGRRTGRRPRGPVVNAAVVSSAAPTYAPPGRHLVQATCLLRERPPAEADVRRHAGELFGCATGAWQEVTRHEIRAALPMQAPPLRVRQGVDLGGGRFVCGDHRDTASIQGALASGHRTARAVATWLSR